jgi:HK97 family phage major capsid protein
MEYAIKALGENEAGYRIGGYLVVFGSPGMKDLQGDYFTPQTDFGLDWYEKRPALYHHGLDGVIGTETVGVIDTLKMDGVGIWAEAQIAKRNRYIDEIQGMVERGELSWSSGSLPHLVKRGGDGQLKRWIIVEGSLTPTPAEPRLTDVSNLKAAYKSLGLDAGRLDDEPEADSEAQIARGAADSTSNDNDVSNQQSEVKMTENQNQSDMLRELLSLKADLAGELDAAMDGRVGAVRDAQKALEEKIAGLEAKMKAAPVVHGANTPPAQKSLGETLQAIKAAKVNRRDIAPEFGVKAMGGDTGAGGGALLPERFGLDFLNMAQQNNPVLEAVRFIPVTERSGRFPVMNLYESMTGGQSPFAAGMSAAARAEGGDYTATDVQFEDVRYNIENAISGKVRVPKELVKDSPISLATILQDKIVNTYRSYLEYYIFNGTGVGQPLGIFNSGALVDVTPDSDGVFARADASEMASRLINLSADDTRVRWVAHKSMVPDIDGLDESTGTSIAHMVQYQGRMVTFIKEYQVAYSMHVPIANASGSINLVDFGAYTVFRLVSSGGEGVEINYYDQNELTHDVWTFDGRMDGQPLVRDTISYSTTWAMSPYVRFND